MENNFCIVFICVFTYILIPHDMLILFSHLPYFNGSNGALFLHNTMVLSFHIDVVLRKWTFYTQYICCIMQVLHVFTTRTSLSLDYLTMGSEQGLMPTKRQNIFGSNGDQYKTLCG